MVFRTIESIEEKTNSNLCKSKKIDLATALEEIT
jgi:hypothetical protein